MIKIVSVNIEGDKHHDTVIPFLIKEKADVVCMQEVFQDDLKTYEIALGFRSFFQSTCRFPTSISGDKEIKVRGSAIFTSLHGDFNSRYVYNSGSDTPIFFRPVDTVTERCNVNVGLLWADLDGQDGKTYRIANTHFTWTPDGSSTEYQKEDLAKLMLVLGEELKEFVLLGDLNAPRGRYTFDSLASKYKDNIPAKYDSSIDPNLHRVRGLKHMVDCLFSTPEYRVHGVELVEGVSDHKAVVAFLEKSQKQA